MYEVRSVRAVVYRRSKEDDKKMTDIELKEIAYRALIKSLWQSGYYYQAEIVEDALKKSKEKWNPKYTKGWAK